MKVYYKGLILHQEDHKKKHIDQEKEKPTFIKLGEKDLNVALQEENDWDKAHQIFRENKNNGDIDFIEPDYSNTLEEPFPNLRSSVQVGQKEELFGGADRYCTQEIQYDNNWTRPLNDEKQIWHLKDDYSQLESARNKVAEILSQRTEKSVIRIAHFDTGYDPDHITYPKSLIRKDLEKNFTGEGETGSAEDKGGGMNGGHGCGTLSILAGRSFDNTFNFTVTLGLSAEHGIEIVPIRIASSVVLFRSKAFEEALEYIITLYDNPHNRCHVITMSMGGAPTRDWAKLVNKAYDKGIIIVTAAGNNFGGVTPRTLVYPARFNRVIAACGVTYDYTPYFKFDFIPNVKIMQGNYGPRRFMRTAIAAFTPNLPWAMFGCTDKVSLSGAGTSSATPQIASAIALYYQTYYKEIEALSEGWQKVEIVRKALFTSAFAGNAGVDTELYFGKGIVKASDMLLIPPKVEGLKKEEKDTTFFPILRLLSEIVTSEFFIESSDVEEDMYNLEIQQLILTSQDLQSFLKNEEIKLDELSIENKKVFIKIIIDLPEASNSLRNHLRKMLE
ncbi:MAG: S8/S53 family peptidase [Sporocytophaga sp.]|uniref:S8/S53 family peptidase n=1 Tax=Sporocytophaga sp. TaxID=2231183 RepID=UPI001B185F21|nr:S8/S53 family peptidase [Sporocytophaga sp.]MBO9701174.1 S8/S53 family peptidase [Sporocytophaga sp.]